MKKLMLGNAAVARGLYEAGCGLISSYPGTPSTEITEQAAQYDEIYCEWAPNEKVALEVAHGAAVGGKRAACCMKHVGLNVAADPLFTISYQGVEAGLVICVADDPGMFSSQNEQDSRHYAEAAVDPGSTELAVQDMLYDPQTSGGLLIAAAPEDADALLRELRGAVPSAQRIGVVEAYNGGPRISLR